MPPKHNKENKRPAPAGTITVNPRSKQKRRLGKELAGKFGTAEALMVNVKTFDVVHLRPIGPNTQYRYNYYRRLWIEYCTFAYKSEHLALETIQMSHPFPNLDFFKSFIHHVATEGRSAFKDVVKGWSVTTTRMFLSSMYGMFARAGSVM
ncbi:hypothetical protein BDZ97DRAFT_1916121 [Flammula alnicola]|nr:hypothetical protein BDZ97DRAFT_1916121 [Flammula alnicola]